jgi:hypothetical protein
LPSRVPLMIENHAPDAYPTPRSGA